MCLSWRSDLCLSMWLYDEPGCCHGDGGGGHDTDAGGGVCARWRHAAGQIVLVIGQTGVYMCTSFTIIGGHFTMSHQYHTKIDDLIERTSTSMTQGMTDKLLSVLESVISKLGRYDEGSFIGSILSFTYRQNVSGSGKELGKAYINFARNSMDQIRQKVNDELWILNLFERSPFLETSMFTTSFGFPLPSLTILVN
ncbi:uncharacterized protein LOC135099288 [Scylla paramamosain]|uniref:uncharacterized protein LOC135099288 n=1 Tax=Scylla paramamosain TaxID=85552 RepID=UPI00308306E7